jgi:hypothetical protein
LSRREQNVESAACFSRATVLDAAQAGHQGLSVTARIAHGVVVLALCVSIGAHLVVLQSVAWGTMVVQYSQHFSLSKAVAQTFDGDHPCNLCKGITHAQHSEKKSDAQSVTIKPDLICATRRIILLPRSTDFLFARLKMNASLLAHSPPTPPPRSELI